MLLNTYATLIAVMKDFSLKRSDIVDKKGFLNFLPIKSLMAVRCGWKFGH